VDKPRQCIFLVLLLPVLLSACGSGASSSADSAASITAGSTTAFTPSSSPTLSPTPQDSPTLFLTNTPSPSATRPAIGPISLCDDSIYLSDVTVPDGTVMEPGEEFTKTWRIKNTGKCDWTTSYALAFVSGNAMEGTTAPVPESVGAGDAVDISVEMAAPETAGTYTGYWRLKNADGAFFGQLVYVQIVVKGAATATTPTPSPLNTPTPTPEFTSTATPETPVPQPG